MDFIFLISSLESGDGIILVSSHVHDRDISKIYLVATLWYIGLYCPEWASSSGHWTYFSWYWLQKPGGSSFCLMKLSKIIYCLWCLCMLYRMVPSFIYSSNCCFEIAVLVEVIFLTRVIISSTVLYISPIYVPHLYT